MQDLFPNTYHSYHFHHFHQFQQFKHFQQSFFLLQLITQRLPKIIQVFYFYILFLRSFVKVMAFLFAVKVFNIEEIFFFCFSNDFNTCCKKILALFLSLFIIMSKTFLVVLIFFINLTLICKKLLLFTKYVKKKGVSRFIFSRVFILFFCYFVTLKILGINLLGS